MRAIGFYAIRIQRQGMLLQLEAALFCDGGLTFFDFGIVEFFHTAALQTNQVVVVTVAAPAAPWSAATPAVATMRNEARRGTGFSGTGWGSGRSRACRPPGNHASL